MSFNIKRISSILPAPSIYLKLLTQPWYVSNPGSLATFQDFIEAISNGKLGHVDYDVLNFREESSGKFNTSKGFDY